MKAARASASYYTQAVVCSCALGSWMAASCKDSNDRRQLLLVEYEKINPHWRNQMNQRRLEHLHEAAFVKRSGPLGATMDRLEKLMEANA